MENSDEIENYVKKMHFPRFFCGTNFAYRMGQGMEIRNRRGFTLIELLVVVAIIGILASILMPALAKARKKANRVRCITNLRSIGTAWNSFAADEGNFAWFLTHYDAARIYDNMPRSDSGDTHNSHWGWSHDIQRMWGATDLKTAKILASPSDPGVKKANQDEVRGEAETKTKSGKLYLDSSGKPVDSHSSSVQRVESYQYKTGGMFGTDNVVNRKAMSYAIHRGGDVNKANSILALTKNWVGGTCGPATGISPHPVQPYDLDGDGQYDPPQTFPDLNTARRLSNIEHSVVKLDKPGTSGQVIYHFSPQTTSYRSHWWSDQYLCAGHIGRSFAPGIKGVSYIGPEIYKQSLDAKYWGGYTSRWVKHTSDHKGCQSRNVATENTRSVYRNLVMMGLDSNEGNILMAGGSAEQISDVELQDRVKKHASSRGGDHDVPLEVVSQPERGK